jgi:hypothetical protein
MAKFTLVLCKPPTITTIMPITPYPIPDGHSIEQLRLTRVATSDAQTKHTLKGAQCPIFRLLQLLLLKLLLLLLGTRC